MKLSSSGRMHPNGSRFTGRLMAATDASILVKKGGYVTLYVRPSCLHVRVARPQIQCVRIRPAHLSSLQRLYLLLLRCSGVSNWALGLQGRASK